MWVSTKRPRAGSVLLLWGLGLSVGLLGLWLAPGREAPAPQALPEKIPVSTPPQVARPVRRPAPPRRPEAPGAAEPAPLQVPRLDDYRAEVARSPHGAAPLVSAFARDLARRRQESVTRLGGDRAFLSELDECVREETGVPSLRALCLSVARDLGRGDADLQDRVGQIEAQAPASVRGLLDLVEASR